MKVVLEVDPISAPLTGIGRYTLALARELRHEPRVSELRFLHRGRRIDNPERLLAGGQAAALARRHLPLRSLARRVYRGFNGWRLRQQARALRGFIYHSPNYTLLPFEGRSVVTVHDLSFLRYPEFHPAERIAFLAREFPKALARADQVITDSAYVADEIRARLGVPRERLSVVPLGVDPVFRPHTEAACAATLHRLGLRWRGYLLIVATIEPRKNFERLLAAFASLPAPLRRAFPLAVAGSAGWRTAQVHQTLSRLEAAGEAMALGYVDEDSLPQVYSGAAAFAFPSLYEGFGLPALEAMACGTPVVASSASALAEVLGEAAEIIEPESVASIAQGLARVLDDPQRRDALSGLGRAQAAGFTWARCARQTVDVYTRIA